MMMIFVESLPTLVLLYMSLGVCVLSLSIQIAEFDFHGTVTEEEVSRVIRRLDSGRVKSTTHCAQLCSQNALCNFFLWEQHQRLCSWGRMPRTNPSSSHDSTSSSQNQQEQYFLYVKSFPCRFDLGYVLRSFNNSTTMCLYVTTTKNDYKTSQKICEDKHGQLVKADTQDKIDLVEAVAREVLDDDTTDFQIGTGLVGVTSTGLYFWPDGSWLDGGNQSELWDSTEPSGDAEWTWGLVWTYFHRLNDASFQSKVVSVCEIYQILVKS